MDPAIQAAMYPSSADALDPRLAMELACQLTPLPIILARHGITHADLGRLIANPTFAAMVKEAQKRWESDLNDDARTQVKASITVESGIPKVNAIFDNGELTPTVRLEAYKILMTLAGKDSRAKAAGSGEPAQAGFSITMNFGDPMQDVTIEGEVVDG